MRRFLLILFLIVSPICYAQDTQLFAISKPDGSVALMMFISGTGKTVEQAISDAGYSGSSFIQVNKSNLPSMSDIDFWTISNGQVVVDSTKKQAVVDAVIAQKQKVKDLKTKLNLSDDEVKTLRNTLNG